MSDSVRFVFGLHLHQPWGNFDHVFQEHVDDVYRPTLTFIEERGLTPFALHVSGPLLEWLETHDRPLHDRIGRLAADGRAELLSSGFYEPILAALSPPDRALQLQWMAEYLKRRFGVVPRSAWLTERVFESEIVGELAGAGVENVLIDDWHLMAAGVPKARLHGHFRTEGQGRELTLVPIHEELRYLVPFGSPEEADRYFRGLADEGVPLAVLGDDGEKFGGWPGTRVRVWDEGWFDGFARVLIGLREDGVIRFTTVEEAVAEIPPSGLVYPPSSSYREMGEWALPPELVSSDEHPFSGAPWRNFLVRYPESNALHKKARALSRICRARGHPPDARRAIARAQCNDPYWHGVFGGIYMKHLRDAAWRQLSIAEEVLRRDEDLRVERWELDMDGEEELWIHGPRFSAQVGVRTGRIKELTSFGEGVNYADVLTRRWEAYHGPAVERGRERREDPDHGGEGVSIHDLEDSYVLYEAPLVDREDRSLLRERVIEGEVSLATWEACEHDPVWAWPGADPTEMDVAVTDEGVTITAVGGPVERVLRFSPEGDVAVGYRWDPAAFPAGALFTVEASLAHPMDVTADPAVELWRYPVVTVPRSERGFERITQGESVTVAWPVEVGGGAVGLSMSSPAQ